MQLRTPGTLNAGTVMWTEAPGVGQGGPPGTEVLIAKDNQRVALGGCLSLPGSVGEPHACSIYTGAQACGRHVNPPHQQQGWPGARICKTRTPSHSLTASRSPPGNGAGARTPGRAGADSVLSKAGPQASRVSRGGRLQGAGASVPGESGGDGQAVSERRAPESALWTPGLSPSDLVRHRHPL